MWFSLSWKSLFPQSEIEIVVPENTETSRGLASSQALANPEASLYLFKARSSVATEYADGEGDSKVIKNRQNVFSELVETEKTYIKDMQTVIDVSLQLMSPWVHWLPSCIQQMTPVYNNCPLYTITTPYVITPCMQ